MTARILKLMALAAFRGLIWFGAVVFACYLFDLPLTWSVIGVVLVGGLVDKILDSRSVKA